MLAYQAMVGCAIGQAIAIDYLHGLSDRILLAGIVVIELTMIH